MSDETIVAVFDTAAHAQAAVRDLKAANVPESAISLLANSATKSVTATTGPAREPGFWSSLFGGEPDHNTAVYERSVEGGSTVVTVKAPDAHVTSVMQILERHDPIDIDERATGLGLTQTTTTTRQPLTAPATPMATTATPAKVASTGGDSIQLAEESLVIGKRLVNHGSTRIRRFVVETPVEETVTLRDETVRVERRPVTDGRQVTEADFAEKTIEVTQTAEEAVVSKTARVVEEISLRKEAVERTETIRETIRKEEVAVEKIADNNVTSTTTTPVTPRKTKI